MRLRGFVKKVLFGSVPFFRGRFRYYGQLVYFPLGSYIFELACAHGIYEHDVANLILTIVERGTTYFDVGANIGLLSVPVLACRSDVKIVSIEASPHTLPFLRKTHAAAKSPENWTVIGAAVGAQSGKAEFWSGGGATGAFDGLKDTGRSGKKRPVQVSIRTLDEIWRELGSPFVSVMKMDIEGGESAALQGAKALIAHSRPILIIEWTDKNLSAYDIKSEAIFVLCQDVAYTIYAWPHLVPIESTSVLKMAMTQTETFVFVPSRLAFTPSQSSEEP